MRALNVVLVLGLAALSLVAATKLDPDLVILRPADNQDMAKTVFFMQTGELTQSTAQESATSAY